MNSVTSHALWDSLLCDGWLCDEQKKKSFHKLPCYHKFNNFQLLILKIKVTQGSTNEQCNTGRGPPLLHLCCTSSGGDTSLVLLDGPFYIALTVDHRLTTPATLPLWYGYEKNEMYHTHMAVRFPAPRMPTSFLYLNIKTLHPNIKCLLKSSGSGPPCNLNCYGNSASFVQQFRVEFTRCLQWTLS